MERVYSIQKERPNTGLVCHGRTVIGRVTAQNRGTRKGDGRSRFFTATPVAADGSGSGSIGTRYITQMAAARALWLFHREYGLPRSWDDLHRTVRGYRRMHDVTPGKAGICQHVPA